METKNSSGYEIVQVSATDTELESYRLCFEKNGTVKDIESLKWLHRNNLVKDNVIYYAMHDKVNVAAIYTAIPVVFNIEGVQEKALQSIDTITDINHRGKGLFPKLATKLFDDAAQKGYALIYGFPNENSAPGFFKKLKWMSLGEAPFLLKPMRIGYFLKRIFKTKSSIQQQEETHKYSITQPIQPGRGAAIKEIALFNSEYDTIWQKISGGIKICVNRSSEYMNWRYVEKPGESYSKYGIYVDNVLKGIVVFTIKNKHNGRIGYLMELLYDPSYGDCGIQLLKFVSRVFRNENVDAALAWCFPHSFNYAAFKKAGYFDLPVKFRPQHLFLGVRSFDNSNNELLEKSANWYISYSDSDTV